MHAPSQAEAAGAVAGGGDIGPDRKTTSLVRSPLLHHSPQGSWQCFRQTPAGECLIAK